MDPDDLAQQLSNALRLAMNEPPVFYKVEGEVTKKYHGAGHAFAAIKDHQLVDLVYFEDLFEEYCYDERLTDEQVEALAVDDRATVEIFRLSEFGEVSIGLLASYEFEVL